jgi:SsrA-binding protein
MAKGKKQGAGDGPPVIGNPRARYRYELLERLECGISLLGPEVKSLRAGLASLDEGYARIRGNELWLHGVHIAEYTDKGYAKHEVLRPRKLLVHKREILRLRKQIERKGLTLVPLRIYFNERNLAKVEVALARGKNVADKRQTAKERDVKREIQRYSRR